MPTSPEEDPTPVRRCVCADVSFAELRAAGVTTLEEASHWFNVANNCGLCRPYVERMLETGETAFGVIQDAP